MILSHSISVNQAFDKSSNLFRYSGVFCQDALRLCIKENGTFCSPLWCIFCLSRKFSFIDVLKKNCKSVECDGIFPFPMTSGMAFLSSIVLKKITGGGLYFGKKNCPPLKRDRSLMSASLFSVILVLMLSSCVVESAVNRQNCVIKSVVLPQQVTEYYASRNVFTHEKMNTMDATLSYAQTARPAPMPSCSLKIFAVCVRNFQSTLHRLKFYPLKSGKM